MTLKCLTLSLILIAALGAETAHATGERTAVPSSRLTFRSSPGAQSSLAKAGVDSHAIYGGPGSTEGRFQESFAPNVPFMQGWIGVDLTDDGADAVGDFAKPLTGLQDIDECTANTTPQLTFIDNGTPPSNRPTQSTGGETSTTWNYGTPGGYVVNHSGGLSILNRSLNNQAWSPEILWDDPTTFDDDNIQGGLLLRYSVWEHLPRENGIFHVWAVRSYDPLTRTGWSDWVDRGYVYYSEEPTHTRREVDLSDLILPGAEKVQIALGVVDLAFDMQLPGNDSTPGPWFDDVSLVKYERSGPIITVNELDRFHDGFPLSGAAFDSTNLGNQAIRLDTGRDINRDGTHVVSGDSMVVRVRALTPGSTIVRPPELVWYLRVNPLFDPVRVLPPFSVEVYPGVWRGLVLGTQLPPGPKNPDETLYAFDLPDGPARNPSILPEPTENPFFFPGDRIWIYVSAVDTDGATDFLWGDPDGHDPTQDGGLCGSSTSQATWKAPAPGSGDPQGGGPKPSDPKPAEPNDGLPGVWDTGFQKSTFLEAALRMKDPSPSKTLPAGFEHPDLLIWDDATNGEELALAIESLGQWGIIPGRDFDVFSTLGAGVGSSNGLGAGGGRGATAAQLQEYEVILYLGGSSGPPLLSDGTNAGLNDKSNDRGVLKEWRMQAGARSVIYFADRIGSATFSQGTNSLSFLMGDQGVLFLDDDRSDDIGGQSSVIVAPDAGDPDFRTTFALYGACSEGSAGDAIDATTFASTGHRFTFPNGTPVPGLSGSVVHARTENVAGTVYPRLDITFPYGLARMQDVVSFPPDSDARSARSQVLVEALIKAGMSIDSGSATATPSTPRGFRVEGPSPNPFNPRTTIWLERGAETARAAVTLHDLRGRRLRMLFEGELAPGRTAVEWDGRDGNGQRVASGVYFVRVQSKGEPQVLKAVLVK